MQGAKETLAAAPRRFKTMHASGPFRATPLFAIAFGFSCCFLAHGEVRTWTSSDGRAVESDYTLEREARELCAVFRGLQEGVGGRRE